MREYTFQICGVQMAVASALPLVTDTVMEQYFGGDGRHLRVEGRAVPELAEAKGTLLRWEPERLVFRENTAVTRCRVASAGAVPYARLDYDLRWPSAAAMTVRKTDWRWATDYLRLPVIHSAIALVIHTILAFVLMYVFDMKVWGLMIATVVFAVVLCVMNLISMYRRLDFRLEIKRIFLIPGIAAVFMALICWAVYYIINHFLNSNAIAFLVAFVLGMLTYFVALFLFNGITEEELLSMPKGHAMVRIAKKLHLLHDMDINEDDE